MSRRLFGRTTGILNFWSVVGGSDRLSRWRLEGGLGETKGGSVTGSGGAPYPLFVGGEEERRTV